ncbi:hypothetical protein [Pelagicoccus sp. SDUM812003]|uniref:hypothetical protein n=1 Tax=Pelagicoccus sp. SDUM812003 TaxID=3041267 RepID=UPI00280EA59F|nr:hypothetical protein [Pelagicoccus sp. SDUM812003]MDQ8205769.1 hypothetical protein [Pelagicoccus sp. SDUM812003]
MTEIFNNPWIVGVGAGVISSLIVAFLTRSIFSKRDKKEYAQKLTLANSEILYAIRPGVSEGSIPTLGVIQSMIRATARKYGVDEEDIHSAQDIGDELIKEVMDSSFISASAKSDFCVKLEEIKKKPEERKEERPDVIREYDMMSKYRRQTVTMISMLAGTLSAVMGVVVTFQMDGVTKDERLLWLALPAGITVLAAFLMKILKDLQTMRMETMRFRFMGAEMHFKKDKEKKVEPGGPYNSGQSLRD